ncbi:unnamed protein product [Trifolium pratense]|uniref:Uncharacterized protein n=1 Tax=Trifolium pratense TaxID=57577 RepID=A0ACB0MBU3_TRIPR|nr:unnamed protein product [Trifolium pratense]
MIFCFRQRHCESQDDMAWRLNGCICIGIYILGFTISIILSQYVLCLRVYNVDPPLHLLLEATSVMVEIRCDSAGSFSSAMLSNDIVSLLPCNLLIYEIPRVSFFYDGYMN